MKGFIARQGALLLVRESDSGQWELPGGRIEVGEEKAPHTEILLREVQEELGDVVVEVHHPLITWTKKLKGDAQDGHVVLVGWRCDYRAGTIRLSEEHSEYRWVDRDTWQVLPMDPMDRDAVGKYWERMAGNVGTLAL